MVERKGIIDLYVQLGNEKKLWIYDILEGCTKAPIRDGNGVRYYDGERKFISIKQWL